MGKSAGNPPSATVTVGQYGHSRHLRCQLCRLALTHKGYTERMIDLRHGDCRSVLRDLPDASVHCCVTDPPYHLTSGNVAVDWGAMGPNGPKRPNIGPTNSIGRGHKTGFMGKQWDGGD